MSLALLNDNGLSTQKNPIVNNLTVRGTSTFSGLISSTSGINYTKATYLQPGGGGTPWTNPVVITGNEPAFRIQVQNNTYLAGDSFRFNISNTKITTSSFVFAKITPYAAIQIDAITTTEIPLAGSVECQVYIITAIGPISLLLDFFII